MIGAVAPIVPSQRTARLCAAILDRRDTVPAPPFSTAVNMVGLLHDDLKALVVLEEAGVEFGLDGAAGRGAREAGQADLLRDAGVKLEHGVGSFCG